MWVEVMKLAFQAFNMAVLDKTLKNRDLASVRIGKYSKRGENTNLVI